MRKINNNRIGETNINNQGLKMMIVDYKKSIDIDVEFEDGYIFNNAQYGNFKNGGIKNPYYPEVYGVGFVGEGNYKAWENGKHTKVYHTWTKMLERCYSHQFQERRPTYKNCIVCDEWHNYQNFAKWYEENIWNENFTYLDKDILIKHNKIYSPDTCILVDNRINCLFVKSDKSRGDFPIGVSYNKGHKNFRTRCKITFEGKSQEKLLGNFKTTEQAFAVYKTFKEQYIKQVANEYKTKYTDFPKKLYQSMYNYEVSIND